MMSMAKLTASFSKQGRWLTVSIRHIDANKGFQDLHYGPKLLCLQHQTESYPELLELILPRSIPNLCLLPIRVYSHCHIANANNVN